MLNHGPCVVEDRLKDFVDPSRDDLASGVSNVSSLVQTGMVVAVDRKSTLDRVRSPSDRCENLAEMGVECSIALCPSFAS